MSQCRILTNFFRKTEQRRQELLKIPISAPQFNTKRQLSAKELFQKITARTQDFILFFLIIFCIPEQCSLMTYWMMCCTVLCLSLLQHYVLFLPRKNKPIKNKNPVTFIELKFVLCRHLLFKFSIPF